MDIESRPKGESTPKPKSKKKPSLIPKPSKTAKPVYLPNETRDITYEECEVVRYSSAPKTQFGSVTYDVSKDRPCKCHLSDKGVCSTKMLS